MSDAQTDFQSRIQRSVKALLSWFRANARDLPWRRTADPYAIWISEIMLQQTQVKTVVPYWERWVRELPTLRTLAMARTDRVLKLWEGLGYYSRARNAQRAAKIILEKHGGEFPKSFAELIELPGIGRYTAGAICSIAFDQPLPILDGNVVRVLTRLFAVRCDPAERRTKARLWSLAESFVLAANEHRVNGDRSCADLNQALMELGALICTPANPNCDACPIQKLCGAFQRRCVAKIPAAGARPQAIARRFVALIVQNRGRFLIRKRPSGVVNAGLWEFPNAEVNRKTPEVLLKNLVDFRFAKPAPFCTIKHTITRYRITLDVFQASINAAPQVKLGKWCTLYQLHRLAFSSAHKRIVEKLSAQKPSS